VRYNGDVAVTVDLGQRTRLERVDVYTFTAGGGSPLSTQEVSLECSDNSTTWVTLGALPLASNGLFSGRAFYANARYLRLTCAKGGSATGQSLAEIVVAGRSLSDTSLSKFAYTYSMPSHTAHADNSFVKMTNGVWNSAINQSIQFGPSSPGIVNLSDPTNSVASNVVVVATLSGVRKLRSAHLYAYNVSGSYVTARVTVSNSLDGVNWSCTGQQTAYESLPASCVRFDFILPNVEARYLAFACEKQVNASFVRQLLAEAQIFETVQTPVLGAPLAFAYSFSTAPSVHVDKVECPKLTDGIWVSNTRNAIRIYGNVSIMADLGAPCYVAGTDLLCWSNRFTSAPDTNYVYGTGRVVVYGGLDTNNMTQVADITSWNPTFPYHHAVTFTNYPYARFLRFDAYLCEDTASATNIAHIMGELTIYRPPVAVVGAVPVEVAGAIPNAGFESPSITEGDAASMLVKGGPADGWAFSSADAANYAGFQRNNSTVSTNYASFGGRYFAPEGSQTAVLMGRGNMEAQVSMPTNGTYALQMSVSSTVISSTTESGGYDFRVRLDGADKAVVTVLQLTNSTRQVLLSTVAAGSHALRFEGVNSKGVAWGALIDNLKLKRYEVAAEQVAEQGPKYVFMADSSLPLAFDFVGALAVKELWLDGMLMSRTKYSAANAPTIIEGPGVIGYDRGTLFKIN
jgi:hypothetical protein